MNDLHFELKIPKERVAVLIGQKGATKKEVETATHTQIEVDSKEGDIFIKGKDGLDIFTAKEVCTAVGRGFNPEIALLLLKVDYCFEMVNLLDKSKESQKRVKGRVIGAEGRTRRHIEELTETYISVFGKTISIIGTIESVQLAHKAVEMLVEGSTHSSVYKWLEKKKREMKRRSIVEWKR
ncbi:RNA-processing protein [Candidatus Woesearchaeota archaeon]|nr:RNA-processing protein [Candidatus Woesearchaeota archaeon]